jgi:hypothetical protein
MTRRSTALLLRRWIPLLLAVAVILGPELARAAGPAPDPASAGAPAPDAAPVHQLKVAAAPRTHVVVPVRKAAVAAATYTPPPVTHTAVVVAQPTRIVAAPVRKHVARPKKPVARPEIKIIDVPPLRVDVHRGLGAVTRSLHDDSLLLLAGIALLVATFTAASGTTLAVIATRSPRRRR